MVDRHKGIATESSFSLAMHRWVNTIIEFISVVEQMDKIGIVEIDAKIEKLRAFQAQMRSLLDKRSDRAPYMMFKELRQSEEVEHQINLISDSYYSSNFDAMSSSQEI